MEQTESVVVQVGPDYENDKIAEMEKFGWNLQNRQEVVGHLREAETPDSLLAAVGRGMLEGATGKKTYEYDHYAKLHFVRPKSLPEVNKIRALEAEYRALPLPGSPGGLLWPVLFTLMPTPAAVACLADPLGKAGTPGLGLLIVAIPWFLLGIYWIKKRTRKRAEASAVRAASYKRAQEIVAEATRLTSNAGA
jgi:hypothetical protein